ncbi:Clr5 domain-containing protein [Whalleya microplaca]|nr:Clr5 domain-containing protein [Whalleya microplaca]
MERLITAAPSGWDTYRDTIIHLYIDRNMSLPRLIRHMELEHQFRASQSMYKLRLAQWGVKKNMNRDRATADLLEQVKAGGSGLAVHGQLVNDKKVMSYLSRLPAEKRKQVLDNVLKPSTATTSNSDVSLSRLLAAPDDLRVPEQYIHLLKGYVKGSSEGHLWPSDPVTGFKNEDTVPAWCSPLMSAAWVLEEGKEDEAQRLIAQYVNQCPKQFTRQDPLIFMFTYTNVLYFAKKRPGIAKFLLCTFYGISESLPWARSHPLRLLLGLLYRLQPEGIISHASNILLAYINMIHEELGEAYPIVQDMLSDTMMRMLTFGLASPERVADLGNRMALVAKVQNRHRNRFYFNLQLHISNSYMNMGKYRMARETATDIMAPHNSGIRDDKILVAVSILLSKIYEAEGCQEEAIESALRAVVESIKHFGQWSDWTVNSLIIYGQALKKAGREVEAERVIQDRDLALKELCEKVEGLTVSS